MLQAYQGESSLRNTICLRSSDPFYIVSYYIKWVTTSWTHSRSKDVFDIIAPENKTCSCLDIPDDLSDPGLRVPAV